jgi:outer membrane protein assembly factor BamB
MFTRLLAALAVTASITRVAAAASIVTPVPATGHPGQTIAITGSGFADSEAVDVYLDTTDTLLLVTSATGTLSGSIALPASATPGAHSITAIGRRSTDAAQHALTVSTPWTQFGYGAAHVGVNPYENTLSTITAPTLGTMWSHYAAATGGTPIISGGRVYVGTTSGVAAFDAATGATIWNKNLGANFTASPTLVGNTLYVGDLSGNYYALNANNGATFWKVQFAGAFYGSAVVANGTIYVGSYQGSFYALKANSGAVVWSYALSSGTDTSAALVNGNVYFGGYDNKIYCLNATTGAMNWSYATGGHVESTPAIANGTLYAGSDDDKIYAIGTSGANAGYLIWSYTTGAAVYASPTISNNHVYIGSSDDNLYALNARDGSLYFSFPTNGLVRSAIAANGVIYFTSQDNIAYAITTYDSVLATGAIGASYFGSPAVSDGRLFIATAAGDLYAFAPNAGNDAVPRHAPEPSSLRPDFTLQVTR